MHFPRIRYWHNVLSRWTGRLRQPLWVKYDPRNLSRLYVRDADGKHWAVPYADLRQPPIALWELEETRKQNPLIITCFLSLRTDFPHTIQIRCPKLLDPRHGNSAR
jgi:Mu transposase, C-terminal